MAFYMTVALNSPSKDIQGDLQAYDIYWWPRILTSWFGQDSDGPNHINKGIGRGSSASRPCHLGLAYVASVAYVAYAVCISLPSSGLHLYGSIESLLYKLWGVPYKKLLSHRQHFQSFHEILHHIFFKDVKSHTNLHKFTWGKKTYQPWNVVQNLRAFALSNKIPGITSKPKPLPMPESKYVEICWNGRLWPFKSDAPCIKVQWNEMDHRLVEPIGVHLLNIRYKHRSECIYCKYKSICKYLYIHIYKY